MLGSGDRVETRRFFIGGIQGLFCRRVRKCSVGNTRQFCAVGDE